MIICLRILEKRMRRDIFYSHPMDPRLETSILPSETRITLTRSYNLPETEIRKHFQYPDAYALESRDSSDKILHRISFSQDGFIDRIQFLSSDLEQKLILKRNRVDKCRVSAMLEESSSETKTDLSLNICDNSTEVPRNVSEHNELERRSDKDKESVIENYSLKRHRRKPRNKDSSVHAISKVSVIDVPVLTERCGYNVNEEPRVYIQMTPLNTLPMYVPGLKTYDKRSRGFSNTSEHSVIILGSTGSNGKPVVNLPDINEPLGISAVKAKCKETVTKHNNICKESHLQAYSKICDRFQQTVTKDMPVNTNSSNQYSSICRQIIHMFDIFCDFSTTRLLSVDKTCRTQYSSTVNIFSADYFKIVPYAVYPDGKNVKGRELRFSLIDAREILRNGFSIRDEVPDFQITGISVIPKDPVPHDIYQVRMNYDCATNSTIIKMEVTGSDQYSNHVTCHGSKPTGSCTLHAAGAQDAVVDNVTMHISDTKTGFNITEKMVVIF